MYARIWARLPGPFAVRLLIAVLLIAAVIVVLFAWVFPWMNPRLPIDNTNVGAPPAPQEGTP